MNATFHCTRIPIFGTVLKTLDLVFRFEIQNIDSDNKTKGTKESITELSKAYLASIAEDTPIGTSHL